MFMIVDGFRQWKTGRMIAAPCHAGPSPHRYDFARVAVLLAVFFAGRGFGLAAVFPVVLRPEVGGLLTRRAGREVCSLRVARSARMISSWCGLSTSIPTSG